jgi:hypothetical protein
MLNRVGETCWLGGYPINSALLLTRMTFIALMAVGRFDDNTDNAD